VHGADPGFLAVSLECDISHKPGGRLPLFSTRLAFTFPTEEIAPLAGTKLYCLVTEAHRFKFYVKAWLENSILI